MDIKDAFSMLNFKKPADAEAVSSLRLYLSELGSQLEYYLTNLDYDNFTKETGKKIKETVTSVSENRREVATVKAQIIKTAGKIESKADEIYAYLSSHYVAVADIGDYTEDLSSQIISNAGSILQLYSYTSGIKSSFADFSVEADTYIKTGLLYYDGNVPVYGAAVGNLHTKAVSSGITVLDLSDLLCTFTSDEIAFWENDCKVAYISSGAVCFPNAVITGGTLNIGEKNAEGIAPFYVDENGNAQIEGYATVSELNVQKGRISSLEADSVSVTDFNAAAAVISRIDSDYLKASQAELTYIKAASLDASVVNVLSGKSSLALSSCCISGVAEIETNEGSDLTMQSSQNINLTSDNTYSSWCYVNTANFYANNAPWSASDRNKKNSIEDIPQKYEAFFDKLSPKIYKFNSGTSGRYHTGFIAQEVESALLSSELMSSDFAGFAKDAENNYYLRYEEFIALCVMKIKKLEERIEALEHG